MPSAKVFRNLFVKLGLALSIALFISLAGYNFKNSYGAYTPDEVIEQYILALENKDESLMRQLVPKYYTADQAVKDKISQFGGYKIQEHQVIYTKPKPVFLMANVQGFYTNNNSVRKKFEDKLTIAYKGGSFWQFYKGRWYLLLGKGNVPAPNVQPAEPQISPPKKSSF